ncbi:hypothetical protein MK852_15440 [Shewanella benthica]|nr:hypothetical protein [Shewanella benthica]
MSGKSVKFYLPRRFLWSALFLCVVLLQLFLTYEITAGVLAMIFINAAVPLIGIWYISVMSISNDGIILYRVNKLVWPEITEAESFSIFGLKYIRLKRIKGMNWFLPLYFIGEDKVAGSLVRYVPEGNPLFAVAQEVINT